MYPHNRMHLCSVAKSCPALCNPMDCSPPGSSVHGTSQERIRECVAISFSRGSSPPRNWTHISCIGRQISYHWATWEALKATENYLTIERNELLIQPTAWMNLKITRLKEGGHLSLKQSIYTMWFYLYKIYKVLTNLNWQKTDQRE